LAMEVRTRSEDRDRHERFYDGRERRPSWIAFALDIIVLKVAGLS
jgi:hypothetical protein